MSRLVARVVQRPDEITELLAFYAQANARSGNKVLNRLSKQLQKGLALSFNRFDGYQLAKYDRDGAVRLRDALFLVHPNAKDEAQQALFDQLVRGELPTPYTWETELSAVGQGTYATEADRQTAVRATWETLVGQRQAGLHGLAPQPAQPPRSQRVGGRRWSASVRHPGRPAGGGAQQAAAVPLPGRLPRGESLPSGHVASVLAALETAIAHSAANLRGFGADTRVVVACDVSSSMQQPISPRSKVLLYDVSLVLGMLLQSRCQNVITGMFGDTWKRISLARGPVLRNVEEFYRAKAKWATPPTATW